MCVCESQEDDTQVEGEGEANEFFFPPKKKKVLIIITETCALEGKHQLTSRASLNKIGKAGKYWKCEYACSLFQIE